MPLRIAVDFDNTIFVNQWPRIGPIVPGALRVLKKLYDSGYELIIWSARASREGHSDMERAFGLTSMRNALDSHGVPYTRIDYGDLGKIVANFYIDDRSVGMPIRMWRGERVVDWSAVYSLIRLQEVSRRLDVRSRYTKDG